MNENENGAVEQAMESAEQAEVVAEAEAPKIYTENEFNAKLDEILSRKIARKEAKIRKEYDRKYGDLENVLKAGTGKKSVEEMTDAFKQFYEKKGIQVEQKPIYSERDEEILASAEADDLIRSGYEDVVEEVERLASIGVENMSKREKMVFKTLAEYRRNAERGKELEKLGVDANFYTSKEFQDFAGKFNSNTPIADIYDIYNKTQPKKQVRTMGSMKNSTSEEGTVKDFYTRDEALQFTKKDFDKNPDLFKAVEASMLKW